MSTDVSVKHLCVNNVVKDETLKAIQGNTLKELAGFLKNSFGPYGSTTCIKKLDAYNVYTKDGHNILSNIFFNGIIEQSIKDDVESITRHIVKTVGDGTTSAVLLSNIIFDMLNSDKDFTDVSPAVLLRTFEEVVAEVTEKIKTNGRECTVEDIYDIAMISSNGDTNIANNIKAIYEEYGMSVFIDVAISNGVEDKIKIYDGVTLEAGFADPCYINNTENNTATIRNANVYFFEDPIDTPEMGAFLDAIAVANILTPLQKGEDVVPTVILCPRLTRDVSTMVGYIIDQFAAAKPNNRPPFVLVTNYNEYDVVEDISKLCGAKMIRKYIDPKAQEKDIANGNAPDIASIVDWCGVADEVEISSTHTKFINPVKMHNEDGTASNTYNSLIDFLEKELAVAEENGENAGVTGNIKRRLNALKANLVEYLVGGITVADRDSARDLVEDAVKNCRSAAANGVGYAANFEAYNATEKADVEVNGIKAKIYYKLHEAYEQLITTLYAVSGVNTEMIHESMYESKRPVNIRDMSLSPKSNVLSSIQSDIVILNAVSEIIGIMFTTNQFLVPTPAHNIYTDFNA